MAENMGRELGWDDQIENDGADFILLSEGDYDFEVASLERGRHGGSDNLPPCNKAVLHLRIETPEGTASIRHQLFLHTRTEGLLCAFFTAIGQRAKGERLVPRWGEVIGSKGRCKVGIRKYEGKEYNEVKRFYEAEQKTATSFQAGKF